MPFEFDWVDAFTARSFGGNGCAVIHGARGLADQTCMAIVRETGLVENTFLEPSDVADAKVRYFMASREIPFAGHPTIATVASLVDRRLADAGQITLETGAGIIPVDIQVNDGQAPVITMTQIRPEFGAEFAPDLIAAVGSLSAGDIVGTPRIVSTGLPFCITLLKDQDALRRAKLDIDALDRFRDEAGGGEAGGDLADAMEPFWVTLGGADDAGHTFARLLLAPPMPPEDPFTGSATGAMAAYLWNNGSLNTPRFAAQQGHWMGRPGQAQVEVLGPPDDISGVRVGGPGYVLMRGYLNL